MNIKKKYPASTNHLPKYLIAEEVFFTGSPNSQGKSQITDEYDEESFFRLDTRDRSDDIKLEDKKGMKQVHNITQSHSGRVLDCE